jgi:hypothetical protein
MYFIMVEFCVGSGTEICIPGERNSCQISELVVDDNLVPLNI